MAGKVKTKDRIKAAALGLFNNEGEREVSAVDIANVIGISPGNLHYHYSGKGLIIEALFAEFETEIRQVLSAPVSKPLAVEDNWIFLYIVFEEIWDFRFFYGNMSSILARIPELSAPFSRILALKQRTFDALLGRLEDDGHLIFREGEREALSERLAMHFTYWLQYNALRFPGAAPKTVINHGVYSALMQVTPYWGDNADSYAALLSEFLDAQG